MRSILASMALALALTACASTGSLTPEQQAARLKAIHEFNIGRVEAAMELGLIDIKASPQLIFWADSMCGVLALAATLESPAEVLEFCADISDLLRETTPAD